MRVFRLVSVCMVFCLAAAAMAQPDVCPALVAVALATTGDQCGSVSQNTLCYGNATVSVTARDADAATTFAAPGDTVDLSAISAVQTAALDADEAAWGVALLALQANITDAQPGQHLTVVQFGDVTLEDAGDPAADAPMQAFTLRSGVGAPPCTEAPASGILIQTPSGVGNVQLGINGVDVTLGSTAVVRAVAGGSMRFTILEGFASLTLDENTPSVTVLPFKTAVLMLDADGLQTGVVTVEDAIPADWAALPLTLLPRDVTTPPAAGGVTPYSMTFQPPVGTASDATVLAGRWAYETVDVDASACPGGSGETGASGTLRLTPSADGTFTLFNADFRFDGEVWRGSNHETINGIEVDNVYEITFSGPTAVAILSSDIQNSPIGPCIIRWTADMQHLGE